MVVCAECYAKAILHATESDRLAAVMEAFGTRNMGPGQMMMRGMPLALMTTALRPLRRRRAALGRPSARAAASGDGVSAGAQ